MNTTLGSTVAAAHPAHFGRGRVPALILALLGAGLAGVARGQVVTEFPITVTGPSGITAGPDGALWFTETAANKIGRIATDGTVTEFPTPTASSFPNDIAAGPDGNLWFTENAARKIGRVTTAGVVTAEFAIPSASFPGAITAGPDGNLWFTEAHPGGNSIGRITTAGVVTEFAVPQATSSIGGIAAGPDGNLWFTYTVHVQTFIYHVFVARMTTAGVITGTFSISTGPVRFGRSIAAGPDGNLWFTKSIGNQIGRITTAGVITEFPAPSSNSAHLAAGPDGNVWFTELTVNRIGRITPAGVVTDYPIPTAGSRPAGIVAGPDGNLWFTESARNKVGRMTTAGVPTEFPLPVVDTTPLGITAGPDGNLWFAESDGNSIGRITTGGSVAEFPVLTASSGPNQIAAGPDGNLWFTEVGANQIGRITTAGDVTEFPIPTPGSAPRGIAAGPDGSLWFTESDPAANKIGRMTRAGVVTGEFPIPTPSSLPRAILAGPDGNLWFTETDGNQIGRITMAGVITEFPIPSAASGPYRIALGPDGNLWFTEVGANQIGRITMAGVITEFPIPTAGSGPAHIAAGVDGNLWFTESDVNQIGRITPAGVVTEFPIPTADSLPLGIATGSDGSLWFTQANANQIGRITTAPTTPWSISVDPHPVEGSNSNANGVLEPGETVRVDPFWMNTLTDSQSFTGTASNLAGPAGTYTINDSSAGYGTLGAGAVGDCEQSTDDCYLMTVSGARPATHWDATFTEDLSSNSVSKVWTLHVGGSFTDVSTDIAVDPYYPSIEAILHNQVSVGCQDGTVFCPMNPTTRQEMAVFLLKASQGASFHPPSCAGIFSDVPCTPGVGFPDWIENLSNRGITAGCQLPGDPLMYCPTRDVLRSEMAVFLLKASQGPGYAPPPCIGIFSDVSCTHGTGFSDWIEDLYNRGITAGCQAPGAPLMYCPDQDVLRQEMAVFLSKMFGLQLYGP